MAIFRLATSAVLQESNTVGEMLQCFAQLHLHLPLLNLLMTSRLTLLPFQHCQLPMLLVVTFLITIFARVLVQKLGRLLYLLQVLLTHFSKLDVSVLGA